MQIVLITQDMHLRTKLNKALKAQVLTCKNKESFMNMLALPIFSDCTVFIDDRLKYSYELICFILSNYPKIKIYQLVSEHWFERPFIKQGNICFIQRPIVAEKLPSFKSDTQIASSFSTDINKMLIGSSESIMKVKKQICNLANNNSNVLIYGETGTGKEIVAKAIHQIRYPTKEMVIENCSFLNDSLSNSSFFGHTKGSFTGAINEQIGLIAKANGSTLFLDEIEELSREGQAKLLRVFQNGEYRRIGDNELRYSNFSLITASNVPIQTLIKNKILRQDFYYRISQTIITIPPLRERINDIPELTLYYENKQGYKKYISNFDLLFNHTWPGNVRELFCVIDRIHSSDPSNLLPTKANIENANYYIY